MNQHKPIHASQVFFQKLHVFGDILNVGCNTDPANLKELGAVNIDICEIDPVTKIPNAYDEIADARDLVKFYGQFDCVVLGEILEHMTDHDIAVSLMEARRCLKEPINSRVLITFPIEHRSYIEDAQHQGVDPNTEYAPGVSAFHPRMITLEHMKDLIHKANLIVDIEEEIHYPFAGVKGYGLVVKTCY